MRSFLQDVQPVVARVRALSRRWLSAKRPMMERRFSAFAGWTKDFFRGARDFFSDAMRAVADRERLSMIDMSILFIIAALLGFLLKNHAGMLTMGFQDYTLPSSAYRAIDLNTLQKNVLKNGGSLSLSRTVLRGDACRVVKK